MIEKLFYYLQGYLVLELSGISKERFINLCKNKEIEIIEIFSIKDTWYCKIRCNDYKRIRGFIKKTGCTGKIKEKRGLPFWVKRCKKRKGLLFGSILFILIITQCSSRIWHISVAGGFLHTREQILAVMEEEMGIYGGVLGEQADCFEIEKRLRLDYNEIGWISVEKKGCRLHVMLNESTMPKATDVRGFPSHIIADRDGIVCKIEIRAGIPQVKTGDTVKKGDILISGIIPIEGDYEELIRKEAVAADGAVYIESDFEYQAGHSMKYEKKNYKNSRWGGEIFLFDHKLFSYIPRYSEGKYDIMSIDIVPYAFEDYRVPLLFRKYRLLQYDTETVQMSEDAVKQKAKAEWEAFLADWEAQGVTIIAAEYESEIKQKVCYVTGTVKATGNFISYQEILEEEWKTEYEYSGNNP